MLPDLIELVPQPRVRAPRPVDCSAVFGNCRGEPLSHTSSCERLPSHLAYDRRTAPGEIELKLHGPGLSTLTLELEKRALSHDHRACAGQGPTEREPVPKEDIPGSQAAAPDEQVFVLRGSASRMRMSRP